MSWFRSAVYKAVEAGGNTHLRRTVRNYADSVVYHAGNAVAGGAKIITDRIGARNMRNFKATVKRLEEVSVSYRGIERVQLLRRWLVALKEIERLLMPSPPNNEKQPHETSLSDDVSPIQPTMVYYIDPDLGTMNFRDVFLYSQALEGITLSMILEAPTAEEVSLLLEIFGLCLAGGKEVHQSIMSNIQDLATAFSSYEDEVLVKREELLHYAQSAIAGLKIDADISRIDAEACRLMQKLDKMKAFHQSSNKASENSSAETGGTASETQKEMFGQIQLCSILEELLVKKRSLWKGDSPQMHAEKVDKLKVLSESLLNSTSKAERRILDHRNQREEALSFRVARTNEVSQLEKDLKEEIKQLEVQKDGLESELKKVNAALNSARMRLHNSKEERESFDNASNELLMHLKSREDEIAKNINSCRVEADVVNTWIKFLQDTWALQSLFTEQKKKQVNADLERCGDHFMNLVIQLLTGFKEQLEPSVTRIRGLVKDFHSCQGSQMKDEGSKAKDQMKDLEAEYRDSEVKFLAITSMVDTIKKQFYAKHEGIYRKDVERINELINTLEKFKEEYESIEMPVFKVENSIRRSKSLSLGSVSNHGEEYKKRSIFLRRKPQGVEIDKLGQEFHGYGSDESEDLGDWEFDH